MTVRKWLTVAIVYGLISLVFSIIFFTTGNAVFTAIAWFFAMCELFSLVQLVRYSRKEEDAANDI